VAKVARPLWVSKAVSGSRYYTLPEPLPELTRVELIAEIRASQVRKVEIEDQEVIIGDSSTRGNSSLIFIGRRTSICPLNCAPSGLKSGFQSRLLGSKNAAS
jgi:hypothetical protein